MKNFLPAVVAVLVWNSFVFAQQRSKPVIAEVKHKTPAVAAPKECLAAFREFFRYLQKTEASIVRDEQAQKRWLIQEYFREK